MSETQETQEVTRESILAADPAAESVAYLREATRKAVARFNKVNGANINPDSIDTLPSFPPTQGAPNANFLPVWVAMPKREGVSANKHTGLAEDGRVKILINPHLGVKADGSGDEAKIFTAIAHGLCIVYVGGPQPFSEGGVALDSAKLPSDVKVRYRLYNIPAFKKAAERMGLEKTKGRERFVADSALQANINEWIDDLGAFPSGALNVFESPKSTGRNIRLVCASDVERDKGEDKHLVIYTPQGEDHAKRLMAAWTCPTCGAALVAPALIKKAQAEAAEAEPISEQN